MVNARLAEQRRDRMQRVAAIATLAFAVAGTAWAAAFGARVLGRQMFTENDQYTIHRLDFTADSKRITPSLIHEWAEYEDAASGPVRVNLGDNLFAVDLDAIRESILNQYVVKEVTVRRELPDTLAIHVTRRIPIARLGPSSMPYTFDVDREGVLVGRSTSSSAVLPRIVGIDPHTARSHGSLANPMAQEALRVIDICDTTPGLARWVKIDSIGVGHPDYLQVSLKTGEFVLLSPEDLKTRLAKLARILEDADTRGERYSRINLTVSKNVAARPAN